jgi:hypothetical protein
MSAAVVQFPEGGKYPAARLTKLDQRVLALIARQLAALRALNCDCSALADARTPEAEAKLRRLNDAVNKPEDELAEIAKRSPFIRGWLEGFDPIGDSRYRREHGRGGGIG